MHQKKFKLFILGLICIANINSFAGISTTFKDRQWEFLEYKFISKPQETIGKCGIGLAISWFVGCFCLGAAQNLYLGTDGSAGGSSELPRNREDNLNLTAAAFIITSPLVGSLAIYLYQQHLWYNAFKKLVEKWPKYKQYTPEEFHEALDELYEQYGQDIEALPKKKAVKIVKIMQEAVRNKNPKKYYNRIVTNSSPQMGMYTGIR